MAESKKESISESGNPVYTYNEMATNDEHEPAFGDSTLIEAISEHIEKTVDSIHMVFHEIVSNKVHIDVNWIKPANNRPFHTLVTTGMSELPMNVPEGFENFKYIELVILLPESWNLSNEDFNNEENYWPIRLLKSTAKFPHEYDTWLFDGHTISNGNPAEPYSKLATFNTALVVPPLSIGEDFFKMSIENGKDIYFFCLVPLYQEEVDYKLKHGMDKLMEKFEANNVSDVVNVNRKNSCKKLFGIF